MESTTRTVAILIAEKIIEKLTDFINLAKKEEEQLSRLEFQNNENEFKLIIVPLKKLMAAFVSL